MSRAERSADMVRQASIMLGRMLGGEETEIGRRLLQGGGLSPDEARFIRQRVESTQRATSPTEIGRKVKESGGLTMGQRSVPTRADLGAAPEPEFPVPAGSPAGS